MTAKTKPAEITHSVTIGNLRFIHWADLRLAAITAPSLNEDIDRMSIASWDVPAALAPAGSRFLKFIGDRPFWKTVNPADFMTIARMGQKYIDLRGKRYLEDRDRERVEKDKRDV